MKKLLIIFLLLCAPAFASQNATTLPTSSPYAGLTMLNNINSAFNTFQTNFSGASAPSSPVTNQFWVDTTNNLLKFYDGTSWIPLGAFNSSTHFWNAVSDGLQVDALTSTGSANAYVVTNSPPVTALVIGHVYPFISNFQNTGAATLKEDALTAHAITKQGAVALVSNDIPSGMAVQTIWDGTEFQMVGQVGNSASGSVTSIATNNGITGGTITTSGTIGLATIAAYDVLSNVTGSTAAPTANTLTATIDAALGSTQGDVLYRGSGSWTVLAPGTSGQVLTSGGASANPSWQSGLPSQTGQSGNYLTTNGTSPSWSAVTPAPPTCTGSYYLQWTGSAWNCTAVSTLPTPPACYAGLHLGWASGGGWICN